MSAIKQLPGHMASKQCNETVLELLYRIKMFGLFGAVSAAIETVRESVGYKFAPPRPKRLI